MAIHSSGSLGHPSMECMKLHIFIFFLILTCIWQLLMENLTPKNVNNERMVWRLWESETSPC